jgi:hypothetical protein
VEGQSVYQAWSEGESLCCLKLTVSLLHWFFLGPRPPHLPDVLCSEHTGPPRLLLGSLRLLKQLPKSHICDLDPLEDACLGCPRGCSRGLQVSIQG